LKLAVFGIQVDARLIENLNAFVGEWQASGRMSKTNVAHHLTHSGDNGNICFFIEKSHRLSSCG
jgi:hypothetical protein